MNYFEFHVGDYEAATAHLSMLEDAAYGRMLRVYYRNEKPLPTDIKQVCRLVRAQSKAERDAVEAVLGEFFVLEADGWHQARCDAELVRFSDAQPEREAKRTNEAIRLKRHREERAALFQRLNEAGQHAPWNTKIEALREMVSGLPATATETQTATGPETPATATHGNVPPLPTSHYPPPSTQGKEGIRPEAAASAAGAARALSVKDRVWALGEALLGSDRRWREKLGKLVSTHGEAVVLDGLQATASEQPGAPYPWLVKACETRAKALPAGRGPQVRGEPTVDLLADPCPRWAVDAGFVNRFEAENAQCYAHNAHEFRDGRRA